MTEPLNRAWLAAQIARMIEDDDEVGPDESLVLFGLDSIRVMEFASLLKTQGIAVTFEELIRQPTPNAWWSLIETRRPRAA
ncbi:phosphopantetheine-binding protein [Paracoccus sp. S1E-3]|uniref:phosphopantetheine-binding protein n=1 Tax=Paracoccus sp. S1E-3 TaxID=2756130 RepID=UPI0015EE9120|nr:phosphopantetheine-binding protein [Paracoccus sp. S1E-3]MBA4489250.1 isochorismatase [Paracoccus sp. S1E-3]